MYKSTAKNAWQVPNSKLLVTIQEIHSYNLPSKYNSGIMFDNDNYNVCTTSGNDKYSAVENLIGKINQIADIWWKILQSIKEDTEVKEIFDWWNLPIKRHDYTKSCFKAILKIYEYSNEYEIKNVFLKSREKCKYCACLIGEKNGERIELFKALPNGDKKIALQNLINAITSVGAILEKIQNGAWNALIDTDNPEYKVMQNHFNEPVIEKVGN